MKLLKTVLVGLLVSGCTASRPSFTEPAADDVSCDFPKRIGFVNDYCSFLTVEEAEKLEKTIIDFNARTGTEIIVVIEDSKKSHARKFHNPCEIAKKWHLGEANKCDDIIIIISEKRKFIDMSYGLETNNKLSNQIRNEVIFKKMIPSFRKKQHYEGLQVGIDYIVQQRTK